METLNDMKALIWVLYKVYRKTSKIDKRMVDIMGVLDTLAVALDDLRSDSAATAARVAEDFAFLKTQIAELQLRVDELVAGQVDPAQLEGLQLLVAEIDSTVNAIEDIPNPVVEPPVEEPVV
jgi:hypothetical protein